MHEQSETKKLLNRWVNVYGRNTPSAGQPLPRKYKFERDVYPTAKKAVHAARKRSEAEGREQEHARRGYYQPEAGAPRRRVLGQE